MFSHRMFAPILKNYLTLRLSQYKMICLPIYLSSMSVYITRAMRYPYAFFMLFTSVPLFPMNAQLPLQLLACWSATVYREQSLISKKNICKSKAR